MSKGGANATISIASSNTAQGAETYNKAITLELTAQSTATTETSAALDYIIGSTRATNLMQGESGGSSPSVSRTALLAPSGNSSDGQIYLYNNLHYRDYSSYNTSTIYKCERMDRLIEIIRRLLLVVIWFFGSGFSLVIVTLSLNEGNPPFYLAVLIVFGFFVLSYICHTLLNWILAYK